MKADTSHIQACKNAWHQHQLICYGCWHHDHGTVDTWIDKRCEQGRAMYDEICQAIEANRDTEHLTAEAVNESNH